MKKEIQAYMGNKKKNTRNNLIFFFTNLFKNILRIKRLINFKIFSKYFETRQKKKLQKD